MKLRISKVHTKKILTTDNTDSADGKGILNKKSVYSVWSALSKKAKYTHMGLIPRLSGAAG
jgi:hypothetical protein